jgi:putative RNA 2'-phosphotransferase
MNNQDRVWISKFLSKHLRHDPSGIGLVVESGGWVSVDALLYRCRRVGCPISSDDLAEVVDTCDKQRFALDETGTRIRANQGHSDEVDLQLAPIEPPSVPFHGTSEGSVSTILRNGLRKMRRHHVHLSPDVETATRVGSRRGRPLILTVDAEAMARAGYVSYVTANGVWLTDEVPPEFLHLAEGPTA